MAKLDDTTKLIIELFKKDHSTPQIAKIVGLSRPTICKRLKNNGYSLKGTSHYLKKKFGEIQSKPIKIDIPPDELTDLYLTQELPIVEIAKRFDVSEETIRHRLIEYQIKFDPARKAEIIANKSREYHRKGWQNKDFLYKEYIIDKKSIIQISKELKTTESTVRNNLTKFNIKLRDLQQANSLTAQSEEGRKARSKNTKKLWQNPIYVEKVIKEIKKTGWKPVFTEEYRRKLSIAAKLQWTDPKYREIHRQQLSSKENIEHLTKISKEFWNDKEKVKKWLEFKKSEEHRMELSLKTIQQWKNPEFKKKLPEIKRKLSDFAKQLWTDPIYREKNLSNRNYNPSSLELVIHSILDELHIEHVKTRLGGFEFDIKIDSKHRQSNKHLLLEINGEYIHRMRESQLIRDQDRNQYWKNNLSNSYDYYTIWEHEFGSRGLLFNKLIKMIQPNFTYKIKYDFPDVKVEKVHKDSGIPLLNKYHYLEGRRWIGAYIGATLNDNLIAIALFTGATYPNSATRLGLKYDEIRELARFCINPIYHKKNLGSWFMSRAIKQFKNHNPKIKALISFADKTVGHLGTLYRASNWIYNGETAGSYHYVRDEHNWHKKTIWNYAKSCSLTESEFASIIGLRKIETNKKLRFIYRLD